MSQSHSFSVEVAQKFGVDIALLLNHFSFWYKKNKADDVNLFKGEYWVRMKAKTLQDYFPYFSERQLRYMVDKMIELKLIKRDEFNQKKNDRTKWYTLTKAAKILLNISTDKNVSNVTHKIVTPTDKNVSSIYKEVDTEYRYNIYADAFDFLTKTNSADMEVWVMQNKKHIPNWEQFLVNYNCKVEEEKLEFDYKVLKARLTRMRFNWKSFDSSQQKNTPILKLNRIG